MNNLEIVLAKLVKKISALSKDIESIKSKSVTDIKRRLDDLVLLQGDEIKSYKDVFKVVNGKDGRDGKDGLSGEDGKSTYELWLGQGNKGTEKDFLNTLKGKDGETIINTIEIVKEKPIIKTEIVKEVIKEKPIKGKDGVGVQSIDLNKQGELVFKLTNGKQTNLGKIIYERLVRMVGGVGGSAPKNDKQILVKKASDLSGTLSSNVDYFIDGLVDMGTTQIKVPEKGLNISGYNFDNSCLFSTADNYTMFIKQDNASHAGYLRCQNLAFNPSGQNSKLFDLDNNQNNNSVELLNCNIGDFSNNRVSSIGELSNYRLVRFEGCGIIRCLDGLTLSGVIGGGLVVTNTIGLSVPAITLFKAGVGLLINGNCRSNANMNDVDVDFIYCDFQPSNIALDGGYRLTEFRTTATNALPNLLGSTTKTLYKFCEGVLNSYTGGKFQVTTEATSVIDTVDVYVKMAGLTTISNLSSFDDGGVDNRLRYISNLAGEFKFSVIGEFSGGNNDTISLQIRKYNSTNELQAVIDQQPATLNGGGAGTRAEGVVLQGVAPMNNGDYVELWIANTKNDGDILTVAGTQLIINER